MNSIVCLRDGDDKQARRIEGHEPAGKKLLLLLGSDKPGEVCAAAQALCRTLKSSAMTFMISSALSTERVIYRDKIIERTKVIYPNVEDLSTREIAQLCLDQGTSRLRDREREFLEDMSNRYSAPTARQEAWLFAIHDRLLGRKR